MRTYILNLYGKPVAVIQSPITSLLKEKIKTAIIEHVSADKDGQFECFNFNLPDYGETVNLKVRYVHDGLLIADDEFTLMQTVCY